MAVMIAIPVMAHTHIKREKSVLLLLRVTVRELSVACKMVDAGVSDTNAAVVFDGDDAAGIAMPCLKALQLSCPANCASVSSVVTAGRLSYFTFPHIRFRVVALK